MEFLRDDDINKVESVTETSENKEIIDSGAETESRLGEPAVEVETPEAWPEHQDRNNTETRGKRLRWLHIIGNKTTSNIRKVNLILISEKRILPFAVLLVTAIYTTVAAIFYFE